MAMYNTVYSHADATGDRLDVDACVYDDVLESFIFAVHPSSKGEHVQAVLLYTAEVRELVRKLSIELQVADLDMPNT